jgi:RsiW-degrading membrane proteinase PrsW (M82 family)
MTPSQFCLRENSISHLATIYALAENLPLMSRWLDRPYLFVFPAISAVAAVVLAVSVRRRRDGWPFYMVALIFLSVFGTLAISFWPYMIPFVVTIDEAAAPHSSLAFMFWGAGLFIFPLMLIYTAVSDLPLMFHPAAIRASAVVNLPPSLDHSGLKNPAFELAPVLGPLGAGKIRLHRAASWPGLQADR